MMQSDSQVNVLLVDDHPENLLALEAILSPLEQNLVKAHSGQEALRCLLNQDFAVILLDVQMPDMDGFETAALIRQRVRSQHTPIIFLTAFSSSDKLMSKGYSLGAVDYLLKPLEPEILISKVTVFVDLFKKTAEIRRQAAQLAAMNAELKTSEERFRSLSACSPVGIFLTDTQGHCTYSNPRCQAICGFTFEESLGVGWLKSIHPEDRQIVFTEWSGYMREGREYSHEFRFQTQEENTRWVHISSSPMVSDTGELLGHVGTVEDITERKQAEEARANFIREQEARRQAEAANRMKDEFLATLSHELRTPLNSMLGWAKLLRSRKFDETTTARALETIERNAKMQAQLIEDILDVSRIIRGKLHLNLRPVNLVRIIESAMDGVRPSAEAKGIDFSFVISAREPSNVSKRQKAAKSAESGKSENSKNQHPKFLVYGDSDRLHQIVFNLLTNAIKFTPEEGKVEVQLKRDRTYAQVTVTDTGLGISTEFLPYIFDRFRQADSTTTRSHGGLGLGLAIVRHLVELHQGSVHADSPGEGLGATFTIKLPLANESSKTSDLESKPIPEAGAIATIPRLEKLQILVVDDDADTLDYLLTVLEQYGAKVTAVSSAREAMSAIQRFKPDVLVSDIGMPEEDGYALIRKIRALEAEQGGRIPALALTAYARGEERLRAISAGFQMHMAKPVEPVELISVVAKLVELNECRSVT
jgi:PAS domain S-box-containing protein